MQFRDLSLLAGLALAAGTPAVSQQDQPPQPVIRTETRVVLVDAVVTDKKGKYVADLARKDFKVLEDGKEQTLKSFSFEADPSSPLAGQKHYMVLFFDNSHMDAGGQMRARQAAAKFVDANAGPNRMMAVVNYSGTLEITQNFTSDADRLKQVVSGVKLNVGPSFGNYGTRNSVLALDSFARKLADVPGRKILVLLTGGFVASGELLPDITATIATCNKGNVAVYPIDVGGLSSGMPDLSQPSGGRGAGGGRTPFGFNIFGGSLPGNPGVMISSFQGARPGGGAAPVGGGSAPVGGGGSSGGSGGSKPGGASPGGTGGGSAPSRPGTGSGSGGAGAGRAPGTGTPTGTGSAPRGGNAGGPNPNSNLSNVRRAGDSIMPPIAPFAGANQQVLFMLADGTGGFVIVNTNDLVAGMEKILQEQDQFYLLSYTPPESAEGTCHSLKVKVERGGMTVRARTGYCNVKPLDLLAGKDTGKTLEAIAGAAQPGTLKPMVALPFFFTGSDTARVQVALELPTGAIKFEKVKGKQHAQINLLGIAYRQDGSVGARFSDAVKLDLEDKHAVEEFRKKPLHYETQFDVASGQYNFKLVVAPTGSPDFGKIERPLVVDPFDGKQFAMSGVALSVLARPVSNVDAGMDALLTEGLTPLIAEHHQFTPTGESRFKSTQQVMLYLELYEPANTTQNPPKMGVRLAIFDSKTGQRKKDGTVEVTRFVTAGNPMVAVPMQIPVSELEAGAYRCEFTASDTLGNTARRNLEIEVE